MFSRIFDGARPKTGLRSEISQTEISSYELPRDRKTALYKHPFFVEQLKDCGSFLHNHREGITDESKMLCQTLLSRAQTPPKHTLFSSDDLFEKTCQRLVGENEAKVFRDIGPLIVPSTETLADSGVEHLDLLRETVNACWTNSTSFVQPLDSDPGPLPQPDFGLGFKRDAFNRERLQKLQPFLGDLLKDSSLFAATWNMYLPFFSTEVNVADLDIADRQNAHTQSVCLRGLYTLFRLVGREKELHQEINSFSISYSHDSVRIYGYYVIIDRDDAKCCRHPIHKFNFTVLDGKER